MHAWHLNVCEHLDITSSVHARIGREQQSRTPKADVPNAGAAAEEAPNAGADATPKAGCEDEGMTWYKRDGYNMVFGG